MTCKTHKPISEEITAEVITRCIMAFNLQCCIEKFEIYLASMPNWILNDANVLYQCREDSYHLIADRKDHIRFMRTMIDCLLTGSNLSAFADLYSTINFTSVDTPEHLSFDHQTLHNLNLTKFVEQFFGAMEDGFSANVDVCLYDAMDILLGIDDSEERELVHINQGILPDELPVSQQESEWL